QYDNPAISTNLISRWSGLTPAIRHQAINSLLSRTDRVGDLVTALLNGQVGAADLSSPQADFLRSYRDPAIAQAAQRVVGPATRARPAVLNQFKEVIRLRGTAAQGRDIFRARCASCHRLGSEGVPLGPDLAPVKLRGKANMLAAVLQPNLEISPGYSTQVIETRHGENLVGIVKDNNTNTITLTQWTGAEVVWPRANINSIQPQQWSLMPEGLEQGLTPQAMADLLEYVMTSP